MNNAFDIERAKRGESIEYNTELNKWTPAHFVGMSSDGTTVVVETGDPETEQEIHYAHHRSLRMASKKIKVRYRNYKLCDAVAPGVSMICDGPGWETPEEIEKRSWFRGWIHDEWQEAEVEQ